MKYAKKVGVVAVLVLLSCNLVFACDLKLLDILTAHWESDKEFSGTVARIASDTKQLSLILGDFLKKNQKYHFPPKNINGNYVSSTIDTKSEQSDAFVKEFGSQVSLVAKLWNELSGNVPLFPEWVKTDKNWDQKCQKIEKQLELLRVNTTGRNFLALHESIASLYNHLLTLLEQGQQDLMKRNLLALSQDVLLLVRGVELNNFDNMKKASEMLKDHVDQLEKSMGKQEIKVLESFKNSVYSLCNIIEENQLFKIVELAGEIEMKFGQLTEGISAEYKIKNLSLY